MAALPTAEIAQLIQVLCRGVIAAIADRPNEAPAAREARAQEAGRQIAAYEPKTPMEVMLAGQAVLFESLALDAVHDAHHATMPEDARKRRQQANALGRMQLSYVRELGRSRAGAARARKEAAAEQAVPPPPVAEAAAPVAANTAPPVETMSAREAPAESGGAPISRGPASATAAHHGPNGAARREPEMTAAAVSHPGPNGAARREPVVAAAVAVHPVANGAARRVAEVAGP